MQPIFISQKPPKLTEEEFYALGHKTLRCRINRMRQFLQNRMRIVRIHKDGAANQNIHVQRVC